jgi:hypothetical protein
MRASQTQDTIAKFRDGRVKLFEICLKMFLYGMVCSGIGHNQ